MDEKIKCHYPRCKCKGEKRHNFEIEGKKTYVNLTFCKYHYFIVIGGNFKAKSYIKDKKREFELTGPFEEIELIQQVIGAVKMVELESDK